MKTVRKYLSLVLCSVLLFSSLSPGVSCGAELPDTWDEISEDAGLTESASSLTSSGSGDPGALPEFWDDESTGSSTDESGASPASWQAAVPQQASDTMQAADTVQVSGASMNPAPASGNGDEAYRKWFTDQCLAYIESNEYKNNIMGIPGSEAGVIADSFDHVMIAGWNNLWQDVSMIMNMVSGEEIRLNDPVEMIIPDIMVKTLTGEEFDDLFEQSYINALDSLLLDLGEMASDPLTQAFLDVILEGSPNQISDTVGMVQAYRESLDTFGKLGKSAKYIKGTESVVTHIDDGFKEAFSFGVTKEAAAQIKAWLKLGDTALDMTGSTFYDILRAKAMYEAYQNASESWLRFWTMVMAEAAVESGSSHGNPFDLSNTGNLAEEIEKNLNDVRTANESDSFSFSYFLSTFAEHSATIIVEEGAELIFSLLHDALPPGSKIKAFMDATKLTHKLINYLTNMDDTSFYGQLAFGSAELARCASFALSLSAEELRTAGDYTSAVAFHDTFNYYRQVQLLALDYTIAYDKCFTEAKLYSIATRLTSINPQYNVWPWSHDVPENYGKKKELEVLQSIRGIWAARNCLLDSQFKLLEQNRSLWDPLQDPDAYTSFYSMAVSDMNNNGRLEITTAWGMGSGRFTEFKMFEVNSDLTGLSPCSIDSQEFQPDINSYEAIEAYQMGDRYWAVFMDFIRAGWASNATILEALSLENGNIDGRVLGIKTVNVTQEGSEYIEDVTYEDGSKRNITESQYNNIVAYYYPEIEIGKMTFRWIGHDEVEKSPLFYIKNSWEGFGCNLY